MGIRSFWCDLKDLTFMINPQIDRYLYFKQVALFSLENWAIKCLKDLREDHNINVVTKMNIKTSLFIIKQNK